MFVEGFRPGIAAKLGASYEALASLNPGLVYCSITGYGQDGPRAMEAGHDINYLAISGLLGALGAKGQPPQAPLNLVADFAGGSMVAAIGILGALVGRGINGKGRYIDAAMIDGCYSLMAMHLPMWGMPHMPARGEGLLAGSMPFYRTYPCADGKYVAVGALEAPFFHTLWSMLDLGTPPDHMARAEWPGIEAALSERFLTQPRDAWTAVFTGSNACVTPVYTPDEAQADAHTAHRHSGLPETAVPSVPRFPHDLLPVRVSEMSDRTDDVLRKLDLSEEEIAKATVDDSGSGASGMSWPPEIR